MAGDPTEMVIIGHGADFLRAVVSNSHSAEVVALCLDVEITNTNFVSYLRTYPPMELIPYVEVKKFIEPSVVDWAGLRVCRVGFTGKSRGVGCRIILRQPMGYDRRKNKRKTWLRSLAVI